MRTQASLVVTISVNGVASRTLWDNEKPFPVGFPVRWVMERSAKGVVVRHFDEEATIRELDGHSLSQGLEVDLPWSHKQERSGFKVALKAVETFTPAYQTLKAPKSEEAGQDELRVYACRGDWTPESVSFETRYTGSLQHRKVFVLRRLGDVVALKSLSDELLFNGEGLGKGHEIRVGTHEIAGRIISLGEFKWRVELQKKSEDPAILFAQPVAADAEALTFRKALKGSAIAVVALGMLALIWPKPQIEEPLPTQVTRLVLKKPTRIASAPNGSKTLSNKRAGGQGTQRATAKPATQAKAQSKAQPSAAQAKVSKPAKTQLAKAKPAPAKATAPQKHASRPAPARKAVVAKATARPRATVAHSTQPAPKLVTPKGTIPIAGGPSAPKRRQQPSRLSQLFSGLSGAGKGIGSGNQLLSGSRGGRGYGDARAEAKSLLESGEGSLGGSVGGAAGRMGGGDVAVGTLGGGYGESSGGIGYGRGSRGKVNGQGKSLVSLDTGASDVEEGLTREQVGRVIHAHMSEIRYCYESAKLRSPELEGKLAVSFVVGAPGSVQRAGVAQSSLPDDTLNDCVIKRLVTWKFPRPKGGVNVAVNYPFIFKTLGR